jgi:uncharacterized membrane protein
MLRPDRGIFIFRNRLSPELKEKIAIMVRVLIAGESWITNATHFKGFDQFNSTTYESGVAHLRDAIASAGHTAILSGIPTATPPLLGYNRVEAKPGAIVLPEINLSQSPTH